MLLQDEPVLSSQYRKNVPQWYSAWKESGWVFLLSRFILLLVTFIGPSVFPHFGVEYHQVNHHLKVVSVIQPPVQCAVEVEHCLLAWNAWDTNAFLDVAHQGYSNAADKQSLVAFFPLWPLIIHIVGDHFGDSEKPLFYVGLILSNICFYFSLVLFYSLVSLDFPSRIAKNALFFLALGPYALFFFSGYSESLFLLLCLGTFFFLRRGRPLDWWLAGLCGFLASLTRGTGFVLMVPFLVLLIQRFWLHRHKIQMHWRLLLNIALPLLLVPCGLFLYMFYLGMTKDNPFAFSAAELSWGRHLDFPWAGLINAVRSFFVYPINFEQNFMDLLFTLIPLATLLVYWRRLPLHYSLFSLAMMIFSLNYPIQGPAYPLAASPRYMMVIFPLYILFAFWCKKPCIRDLLMRLSLSLFTIYALLFICHGWVA
ncbi:MAG TPA: mannosyltransferase family protein [Ktedonobacteraceae bacterium]|nr:mannosyltransferase family protein [Ktedonobacteraceae bacterium]